MQRISRVSTWQESLRLLRGWYQPRPSYMAGDIHTTSIKCNSETGSPGEKRIEDLLKSKLDVKEITVRDISGGCGSMYEIFLVSKDFKDKRTVQQHRMVNEILKEEVKQMHGLRIHTQVPQ